MVNEFSSASIYPVDLERTVCNSFNLNNKGRAQVVKEAREATTKKGSIVDLNAYEINLRKAIHRYILT